jgi:uncharacterized protein involved in exopolysaccharide biosynthesis
VQVGEVVPAISVGTFRVMIESQSIAAQLVKEFKLDAEPLRLTPQRFLASALGIETPRDTNVVVLRVRLADRELPAKVANRLAALATGLASRLSQDEAVITRDAIKAQVEQSRGRMEAAEDRLGRFKQQAQVEALRKDVEAELGQRSALLPLAVEIETERATLAKAEEELAKRQAIRTVKRTIDADPVLMEAGKAAGRAESGLLGLETRNEFISEVYDKIDQQVAESRARLSGLEKKRAELVDARRLGGPQLAKLNLLYEREAELDRLMTEHDLARKIYLDVATRYEQVRLQVAGRTAQLQLLDSALTPDLPVGPRVLRNTAATMILCFTLVSVALLFLRTLGKA